VIALESLLFVHLKEGKDNKQLIILPYLGGYAEQFQLFADKLQDGMDIWAANPPGHFGSKIELVDDIEKLVDMYYNEIKAIMKDECTILGYSMGGNIAYFLAKKIIDDGMCKSKLKALIIAASAPPCTLKGKRYSTLPREKLLDQINSYGGLSEYILKEKEVIDILVPIFRADYKIMETAESLPAKPPLDVPTYLLCGENDSIEPMNYVGLWLKYIGDKAMVFPIAGAGHMFINTHTNVIVPIVNKIVNGEYAEEFDEDDI
jgi:external thioesterase TEII